MLNLTGEETGNLIYLIILLGFIASGTLFKKQIKASQILKQLFWWFLIILVIIFLYSFRHDFDNAKNRLKSELFPSSAMRISDNQIRINISQGGHFYIKLKVNGEDVSFMIDTGASDTVLSQDDAKKVGINLNNLSYNKIYNTANGKVFAASVKLDKVELSGIIFYDIYASVNNSNLETSLLGMSFLKNFKKYEFYQDKLVLTY